MASHFNKVARLDKIDTATQNVNSAIRQLTSDIKYEEEQEIKLQEDITKFDHLEAFEVEVEVLEEMDKQLIKYYSNYDKLEKQLEKYKTNEASILEYKETLELEEPVNNLLALIELRAKKDIEVVKLDKLVCQIKKIDKEIEEQKGLILIEKPLNALLELFKELKTADKARKSLFKALSEANNIKSSLNRANALQVRLQTEFKKEMGLVCILCGSKLK